ncbi:MAG: MFS transporter, partial [Burkholderiales bacterium]|nr:MFS transporter [Anaerolineae bacterium]
ALSSLLYAFPGFWPLLIGRLLWGITWAGIWIGGSTVVLDVATPGNRGRMVGRLQMWSYLGLGVTAIVGGLLTDTFDYTTPFIISAVLNVLAAVAWWLFLPETHPDTPRTSPNVVHTPEASAANTAPVPALTIASKPIPVVSHGAMLTAVVLLGLNWLFFLGALGAVLSLLLQERIGATVLLIGLTLEISTFTGTVAVAKEVCSLITSPLAGWLSDRQGRRWWLIVIAVALGIISLALVAVSEGVVLLLAILLTAVVSGVLQTQSMTLAGDYARSNQHGRIIGLLNTVGDVGSAGGPLLAFALLPIVGLSGVFTLAALLMTVFLPLVIYRAWREGH